MWFRGVDASLSYPSKKLSNGASSLKKVSIINRAEAEAGDEAALRNKGIQRSSFYAWKKKLSNPSDRAKSLVSNVLLFQEYHLKYPSHGYRWLNAKIRLDTGLVLSDPYSYKCCKIAGIKSKAKHYKY